MNSAKKKLKKIKKPRRKRIIISKSTIYTIAIILLIFVVWQFVILPKMVGSIRTAPIGHIPELKRGDTKFVDEQLSKRILTNIPSLTPPKEDIGKKDPFE